MSFLLQHDWSDRSVKWIEDHLQMAVAQKLRRLEDERDDFTFAADMGGMAAANKRVAGRAKLMGLRKGETDLRLYFAGPRLLMIEMKTINGALSDDQKKRHALFKIMGFDVQVVRASCPNDAVAQVTALVEPYLKSACTNQNRQ